MQTGDRAALHTTKHKSGVGLDDDFAKAWDEVRSNPFLDAASGSAGAGADGEGGAGGGWVMVKYQEGSKDKFVLDKSGRGGLAALLAALEGTDVRFAGLGVRVAGRPRLIFISHIGESCKMMVKARAGMHRQGVLNEFTGIVADLQGDPSDPITAERVEKEIADTTRETDIEL